jgi:hypothetical protein
VAALVLVAFASLLLLATKPQEQRRRAELLAGYARGLSFLEATQRPDGRFPTYYWRIDDPSLITSVRSVFTVSQILYSLARGYPREASHGVAERAAAYLLAEREPPGLWRYYGKAGASVLSPDVDDTSLAWAALASLGYPIAPEALADLLASRNDAGLFNTWIGDPSTWVGVDSRDTDLVVNLNALLAFSLAGRSVDEVCRAAVATARRASFDGISVYYPSPLAFTYALSRAYADGRAACLTDAIRPVRLVALAAQRADGGWGNDLETALGLLTLLNAGYHGEVLERGIRVLLDRQAADGGWAIAPAYRAAVLPLHYGSRALTTAMCLEAIGKYLRR